MTLVPIAGGYCEQCGSNGLQDSGTDCTLRDSGDVARSKESVKEKGHEEIVWRRFVFSGGGGADGDE